MAARTKTTVSKKSASKKPIRAAHIAKAAPTKRVTKKPTVKRTVAKRAATKAIVIGKVIPKQVRNRTPQFVLAAAIATIATQILLLTQPLLGAYACAATLMLLVTIAARSEQARVVATSMAILPVAFLVSLAAPQSTAFNQSLVFYDVILLQAVIYRYLFAKEKQLVPPSLPLKSYAYLLPTFIVSGQLLGAVAYGLLRHEHVFGDTSLSLLATSAIILAIAEELLFRGLIQESLSKVVNPKVAVLATAVLYATATIPQDNLLVTAYAVVAGLALSTAYYFKPSIVLTSTANLVSKLLFIGLLGTL